MLAGSRGATMASTRFRLRQRIREDAALAHAEFRAAGPADFPAPSDLTSEERAVYRAAATGYITLFADRPGVTLDIGKSVPIPEAGIEVAARPGVFLRCGDGNELRALRLDGTTPRLTDAIRHAVALLAGADFTPMRIVVVDLLSLETVTATIEPSEVAPSSAWVDERLAAWRGAIIGNAVNGAACLQCEFVWDCPIHRGAR